MFKRWKDPLQWRSWVWVALLFFGAVLPYANTLSNAFVYDDVSQILENPYIRSFHYLPKIFGSAVWSFTGSLSRYYRPLMTFGYLLCYKAFGFSPAGFHLVSVLMHAATVCLIFTLTRRMFGDRTLALGTAALFALHPIHTESVTWIAAVTDLELTFFYALAFWFFLELDGSAGRRRILVWLAMTGSFTLALLSKEQAFTLPFLATVYEHFYRENRAETNWARKLSRYLPLWLLAAAYLIIRRFALGGLVVTSNHWEMTRQEVILSALALIGQYLWKLIWPVKLCAFYVFDKSAGILDPPIIAGVLSGILLTAGFGWLWKRSRLVSFGLIWLVVTLGPVLNPKWLGENVFAERYLYLPSVGFCWVSAWGLIRLWRLLPSRQTIWRQAFIAALGILAILCGWRIVIRNSDWRDEVTLYTRTLEVSPNASTMRVNLANVYQREGLLQQAETEYREGLARDPGCAECLNHLGRLFVGQSRYAEATDFFLRAIQLNPRALNAHLDLGMAYQLTAMMDRAEQQFRIAATLAPRNSRVHVMLGSFYYQQGDHPRAETELKQALSINPYNGQARIALGKLYESDHRVTEAIQEFQTALQNEPGDYEAIVALRRLRPAQN